MGFITFLGILRQSKSGQIMLTIPKKFEEFISIDKVVYVKISNERNDLKTGESIHPNDGEKMLI